MNWVFQEIQTSIQESLADNPWLPWEFTLTIDDTAFIALIGCMKYTKTGQRVPVGTKRILLTILDHKVTVRSELDPEPWMPMPLEEALH